MLIINAGIQLLIGFTYSLTWCLAHTTQCYSSEWNHRIWQKVIVYMFRLDINWADWRSVFLYYRLQQAVLIPWPVPYMFAGINDNNIYCGCMSRGEKGKWPLRGYYSHVVNEAVKVLSSAWWEGPSGTSDSLPQGAGAVSCLIQTTNWHSCVIMSWQKERE